MIPVTDPFGIANDPELPLLAQAIDPPAVQAQFDKKLARLVGDDGDAQLQAIRVTRYKPQRRCVIEYDLRIHKCESVTLMGKARRKRFGNADYRLLDSIWRAGFAATSADGISVAEPIGVLDVFEVWLQRKVRGRVATPLLTGPNAVSLAERIAEAAFKLHGATERIPTERTHTMAGELRILHERLARVAQQHPDWAARVYGVLAGCEAIAATVKPCVRGIHRDFYSDQIIVDGEVDGENGERLHLIDFDLYCRGDVGVDIGNFMAHIAEQSLRELGDARVLLPVEQALETRYVALAGEAVRHTIRVYRALSFARHISLSTEMAERQHLTERLIGVCEAELNKLR